MILTLLASSLEAAPTASGNDPAQGQEIVVTGDRSGDGRPAKLVGGSVTLIDAATLRHRQVRKVADVLRDVPGVVVSDTPGFTQVRIRGTEANHTLVLVDGIEVSDPFAGEFDFSSLNADEGGRLEILRGQQSALYGSDAIGGVIQYITASGRDSPGASVRLEAGSFGTAQGAARIGGASGTADYALSGTLNVTGGTPGARGGSRRLDSSSASASAKLGWEPLANLKLTGVVRWSQLASDFNLPDADPSSATFGEIVDTPGNRLRTNNLHGLASAELKLLGGRWTHSLSAQFTEATRDTFDPTGRTSGSKGGRAKASYSTVLRWGDRVLRQRLTLGSDLERESFRNADPTGFAFNGWRHVDNAGLVGEYELILRDNSRLSAAVRHDFNSRFADDTTWRVEASTALGSGTRIHAATGAGIKNPGIFELFGFVDGQFLGNPDLRPEKSIGWEAGIEQQLAGPNAQIGLTYFRSRLHDEIIFAFLPNIGFVGANSSAVSPQQGVEATARVRVGSGFRLDAAYTYLDARENGREEVRRPRHSGSLALDWHPDEKRFGTTVTLRYNGSQTDDAFIVPPFGLAQRVRLHGFVLFGAAADYRLSNHVELFARTENLLNQHYEEVFSFTNPGRSAFAGLRWKI